MKQHAIALVLCFFLAFQAGANNGEVAYAFPVDGLKIDGDLSDWPEHLTRNLINRHLSGGDMPPAEDFSASFRAAYSLKTQSLYFAMEISDQSHIVAEESGQPWNAQDGVTLYIDAAHSLKGSGAMLLTAIGPHRELIAPGNSWDPAVGNASWDASEAKVVRDGLRTIYEWRVGLGDQLKGGRSIGLDFLICDQDQESQESQESNSACFIWGRNSGKSRSAARIGDLVLVKAGQSLGTLAGQVGWKPDSDPAEDDGFPRSVRITSVNNPSLWIQVRADDDGRYQAKLPPGEYSITSATTTFGDPWRDLKVLKADSVSAAVKANATTQALALQLASMSPPDLLQSNGVLFDYDGSQDQQIDQFVKAYMDYYQVPGTSIALVKDGKLAYHRAFGISNAYTGEPVTDNTLFEAASITKIVFAFAVSRLAERGVIDLDKPLYQYLPFEEIAHDERYKKITARMALSHQTGFPNWRWQNDDGEIDIKFYPGIKFGYSGEGFEYLGRVVSHITGKSLEEVLMEEVQKPMGFERNTFFSDTEDLRKVVANGHFSKFATPVDIPGEIGVAHSMHTEAKVFSNFMIGLIKQHGLSEESYRAMLEPQVEEPAEPDITGLSWPSRYSLGFHLLESPYGLVFGHGGSNGDFLCRFEIYEEHDLGFIVFTNSDTGYKFYQALREFLIIGKAGKDKASVASLD